MLKYRVKQFIWAITAYFNPINEKMLEQYLNDKELNIFKKMKVSEQQHCIRVCKDALFESKNYESIDENKLAKIALLHDVGKVYGSLNVIDKSVIVILDKITKGNLKRYTYIKKIDVYYNHPKKSLKLLKKIDKYDKEFLEAIGKHHQDCSYKNDYLRIIKKCDDNN